MTPDDVRAAAEQLVTFPERFAPLFGKEQAQDHAYDYVKGLMVCPDRKSIELGFCKLTGGACKMGKRRPFSPSYAPAQLVPRGI
jgi:hypothetical protein